MTRYARRQRLLHGSEVQHVTLTIERITLEGVSRIEGQRIADSLTNALSRALEGPDLPEVSRQIAHQALDGPVMGQRLPEEVGQTLAGIVARQVLS